MRFFIFMLKKCTINKKECTMTNIIFCINIVLPIFLLMGIGFFLRKKIINDEFLTVADRLSFRLFMPCILFYNIYKADLNVAFSWKLIGYVVAAVSVATLLSFILTRFTVKDRAKRGVAIQGMMRSNSVLFAIPICQALYDGDASMVSIVLAFYAPLINVFSVIALSLYSRNKQKITPIKIIKDILTNPFVIASVLGICCNICSIHFITIIEKTISDVAKMATPFALIVLGANFTFTSLKKNASLLSLVTAMKVLVYPFFILLIAKYLGFRGMEFSVILATFCAPVAVNSYVMAKMMDCDEDFASQIIVTTTFVSMFSLMLYLYLAKIFALL